MAHARKQSNQTGEEGSNADNSSKTIDMVWLIRVILSQWNWLIHWTR